MPKKTINKKRVSKGAGAKGALRAPIGTLPSHLMGTPPSGGQNTADTEMARLMKNKGVPRKKAY